MHILHMFFMETFPIKSGVGEWKTNELLLPFFQYVERNMEKWIQGKSGAEISFIYWFNACSAVEYENCAECLK